MIKLPQLRKKLNCAPGETLLDVFKNAGIMLDAPCGGNKKCKKCRIRVKSAKECSCKAFLPYSEYMKGIRLACFYKPDSDCEVYFPYENNISETERAEQNGNCAESNKSNETENNYICAVDIGTTTVALKVFDKNENIVRSAFFLNPQKSYGADVISRIQACNEGHLETLNSLIINALRRHTDGVSRIIVAANTAMLHIFRGVHPKPIGEAPYRAVFTGLEEYKLTGSNPGDSVNVVLMPGVSAYIGADVVAGILSSGMYEKEENSLLIDLGTNAEIVLKAGGRYFAAAAAAGPAFEGGKISCGGYADKNAVAGARLVGDEIILDKPDGTSVCGAGLIDMLACFRKREDIDGSGAINVKSSGFVDNGNTGIKTGGIILTQADIRELQLAKAAIHATVKMLIKTAGINENEIARVYLAGGFGKGLNPESAAAIGLIPKEFQNKTTAAGNASLAGAEICALNGKELKICEDLARSVTVIELTQNAEFLEYYTDAMWFD